MSKEKTLEEWIEFYNRKCPEPFKRDEKFSLFFIPDKGFCEIRLTEKMVIGRAACGDIKFFRILIENIALIYHRDVAGTYCVRKILPYIRWAGFKVIATEGESYLCEDKQTGQKARCSPVFELANGEKLYLVTWRVKADEGDI